MLLEGKHIFITGAARGIGLATGAACLKEGAIVTIADIDGEALAAARSKLAGSGSLTTAEIDVSDPASIDLALAGLPDCLDGLVNNAAILDHHDTGQVPIDRWNTVFDINLSGALRVTQAALPRLRRSASPAVVNTVSTQAFFGQPNSAAYASAKGGLMMLTRSMAVDLGADGIRVNAVAPGFIDTRMARTEDGSHEHQSAEFLSVYIDGGRIPLRRPGTPEDCAGAFVFLLSDLSRYVTGQAIFVDGGLTATY